MKKLTIAMLAMALSVFVASKVFAGVSGSKHDFSGKTWNSTGVTCQVCHMPHKALKAKPLWARADVATTFTLYEAYNQGGYVADNAAFIASRSGMCLSCHDGTLAVGGTDFVTGNKQFGPDLSDSHPIGVAYPTSGEFTAESGGSVGVLPLDGASKLVSCSSCHDVHNGAGASGKLLRVSEATLCSTCHTK